MSSDGRNPSEMLRNGSYRGRLARLWGIAWTRIPGSRLLQGWHEANRLELVWLATENTEELLCDDEHGVCEPKTIKRQPESARWRQELVDKLFIGYSNLKPKSATVVDSSKQLEVLRWSERVSLKVNIDEAPKDKVPEPAITQKRWHMNETLIEEYDRAMSCQHCLNRVGVYNGECRGWIDGIMLRRSRTKQTQAKEPIPMESMNPTGPATQHGGSCKRGVQRSDIASSMATQSADEELLEVPDIKMDTKESDETRIKQTRTIMGLYVCVLGAPNNGDDKSAETTMNLTKTCWANATDEDVAAPETTVNPNQLKTSSGWREEPTVEDTTPRGYGYGQKIEPVCGRFVENMKNDRAKSRFVAAEVTGDVGA